MRNAECLRLEKKKYAFVFQKVNLIDYQTINCMSIARKILKWFKICQYFWNKEAAKMTHRTQVGSLRGRLSNYPAVQELSQVLYTRSLTTQFKSFSQNSMNQARIYNCMFSVGEFMGG